MALAFAGVGVSTLENKGEVGDMNQFLPSNPNLDLMKKEARNLLHGLLERESTALGRYYSSDPFAGSSRPRLEDAQYIIAREHGYSSWRKMEAHLMQPSGTFQIS